MATAENPHIKEKGNTKGPEQKPLWGRYVLWLLVPIILALYYSQDSTVLAQTKHQRQILPANVRPLHYDLELTPNLETFVYDGKVKVNLSVVDETSVIVLNANEINITKAAVVVGKDSYSAIDTQYDETMDQVSLTFGKVLSPESIVVLELDFQGTLNDEMSGFYRSSYKDKNGDTKYLATTQFEATDARKAFPCWDEPSLKATFDVTLNVPENLTALSNMNVISEVPSAGDAALKTVKYATTPRMSTYLLAFIVGPLEYIEDHTTGEYNGHPIRTRVYTLPGYTNQGRHALNVATKALEYYAQVFGIAYPLPKLDLVAIPDFDAGAMENWGLVTFRTTALLYDEQNSAFVYKRQTAYVVAHELAHQWFGNLVTMEWWDHLWLNEGFATWVGWFAVDRIFPEWRVWVMFATQNMQEALGLDGLRSSHPVEVAVNNPSEIHQIFDSISYLKGASVIRMVDSWLTTPIFLAGIHRYLNQHRLGNAATSDLWSALSSESGKNVSEFMNTWIQRTGYPVLNVTLIGGDKIQVTQSRYLLTGDLQEDEDSTVWWVPLRIQTAQKVQDFTLTNKSQEFPVPKDKVFKLNQGQTSLYRVNYDTVLTQRLVNELKKPNFGVLREPVDRAGFISDLGVLGQSGEQSTVTFLEAADASKNEKNFFVLTELSHQLGTVVSLWEEFPEIEPYLQDIRRNLFGPLAKTLGWRTASNEPELYNLLRVLVISEAGLAGDADVVAEAKKRYGQFISGDHAAVSPDLRSTVYKIVLKNAADEQEEDKVWQEIFSIYKDDSFPVDQQVTALTSLGYCIKSNRVISKTLDLISDDKQVRTQDAWMVFKGLGANYNARYKLIEFFESNYDKIFKRFSKSMGALGNAVGYMVSDVNNAEKIQQIESFFATKDSRQYSRSLNNSLERAKVNAALVERQGADMQKWASAKKTAIN
ncbi:aminopeptidase [Parasitella parasitica]|nr:aminopeptidase [Parasitella parasitica]